MNGEAAEKDEDEHSAGKFSNNYMGEETVGDAICRNEFAHEWGGVCNRICVRRIKTSLMERSDIVAGNLGYRHCLGNMNESEQEQ